MLAEPKIKQFVVNPSFSRETVDGSWKLHLWELSRCYFQFHITTGGYNLLSSTYTTTVTHNIMCL